MKPYFLIVFTFLLSATIFAQDSLNTKPKFIIKADIAVPIIALSNHFKAGSLTAEFGFKKRHSLQVMGLYRVITPEKILQITPMYKFFFSKKKLCNGFYGGVHANLIQDNYPGFFGTINGKATIDRYNFLGGGLLFGYQTYIKKHLVIDALIGAGISELIDEKEIIGNTKFDCKKIDPPKGSFYLIFALNIGYKF